jgi:hypothetical protein
LGIGGDVVEFDGGIADCWNFLDEFKWKILLEPSDNCLQLPRNFHSSLLPSSL